MLVFSFNLRLNVPFPFLQAFATQISPDAQRCNKCHQMASNTVFIDVMIPRSIFLAFYKIDSEVKRVHCVHLKTRAAVFSEVC